LNNRLLNFIIVNSVPITSCEKLLDVIRRHKNAVYLLCGNLGECLESLNLIEKGFGIPSIYDDEYIIKLLKSRNFFVGGTWKSLDGLCISGIDAKNPVQEIDRITKRAPAMVLDKCVMNIVISAYPLAFSRCSSTIFKGKRYSIGLPYDLSRGIVEISRSVPTVVIACPDYLSDLCLDRISDNLIQIVVPRNIHLLRVEIDIENRSITSMSTLNTA